MKVKNSLGTINDSIFFSGCTKPCKIIVKVKNPNDFQEEWIYGPDFHQGLSGVDSATVVRQDVASVENDTDKPV